MLIIPVSVFGVIHSSRARKVPLVPANPPVFSSGIPGIRSDHRGFDRVSCEFFFVSIDVYEFPNRYDVPGVHSTNSYNVVAQDH